MRAQAQPGATFNGVCGSIPAPGFGIATLPARSCVIDGEAIAVDMNGLSVFDLIRYRRQDHAVLLCAFIRRPAEIHRGVLESIGRSSGSVRHSLSN